MCYLSTSLKQWLKVTTYSVFSQAVDLSPAHVNNFKNHVAMKNSNEIIF